MHHKHSWLTDDCRHQRGYRRSEDVVSMSEQQLSSSMIFIRPPSRPDTRAPGFLYGVWVCGQCRGDLSTVAFYTLRTKHAHICQSQLWCELFSVWTPTLCSTPKERSTSCCRNWIWNASLPGTSGRRFRIDNLPRLRQCNDPSHLETLKSHQIGVPSTFAPPLYQLV